MNRSRRPSDRSRAARRRPARPSIECLEGRLLLTGEVGGIRYGSPEEVARAVQRPGNSPDVPFLNTPAPGITVGLAGDPSGSDVAITPKVMLSGVTTPGATVWLGRGPRGAFTTATQAGADGYYQFEIVARPGDNLVRVFAGHASQFSEPIEYRFTSADAVVAWDAVAIRAVANQGIEAPEAARNLAILHVAQHDAIASIRRPASAFITSVAAPKGASETAAAHAAAYAVLAAQYPEQKDAFLDVVEDAALAGLPKTRANRDGLAVGRRVAAEILARRSQDGSDTSATVPITNAPGTWRPTPPDFEPAVLPQWGRVTPFAIADAANFLPEAPPAVGSSAYDAALAQVRVLGVADGSARTPRQTLSALFWDLEAGTPTTPSLWNQAAERLAVRAGRSLRDNARTFAMLDVALADAAIVTYNAKYANNLWRPITAIQQVDPAWTPLITTPASPSYPSEQAAYAAAASTILTAEFGPKTPVSFSSASLDSTRVYDTFAEAASDAGLSGVYGGVQFSFDVSVGADIGERVAGSALAKFPRAKP